MFGYGSNDGRQRRYIAELMFLRHLRPQTVQIDILLWFRRVLESLMFLDQGTGNIRARSQVSFVLRRQIDIFGLPLSLCQRHCFGRHPARPLQTLCCRGRLLDHPELWRYNFWWGTPKNILGVGKTGRHFPPELKFSREHGLTAPDGCLSFFMLLGEK